MIEDSLETRAASIIIGTAGLLLSAFDFIYGLFSLRYTIGSVSIHYLRIIIRQGICLMNEIMSVENSHDPVIQ